MKRIALFLICTAAAFGQAARVDSNVLTTNGNVPSGAKAQVLTVPGSTLSVCANSSCSVAATTYTDATMATPCPGNAPITLPGSTTCVSSVNQQGQFGFWANSSSNFYYKITLPGGQSYGPFAVTPGLTATALTVTSNTPANNGAAIVGFQYPSSNTPQTVQSRLSMEFFVTDFGAKCDGTTDDSAAIQAGLNLVMSIGGELKLPAGGVTCVFSSQVSYTWNTTPNGVDKRINLNGSRLLSKVTSGAAISFTANTAVNNIHIVNGRITDSGLGAADLLKFFAGDPNAGAFLWQVDLADLQIATLNTSTINAVHWVNGFESRFYNVNIDSNGASTGNGFLIEQGTGSQAGDLTFFACSTRGYLHGVSANNVNELTFYRGTYLQSKQEPMYVVNTAGTTFDNIHTENGWTGDAVSVLAATNASPIAITTASPTNSLITGSQVTITSVNGNTAANVAGNFIHVIDSTHFTLDGTTGNGAYTGGGTVNTASPRSGLTCIGECDAKNISGANNTGNQDSLVHMYVGAGQFGSVTTGGGVWYNDSPSTPYAFLATDFSNNPGSVLWTGAANVSDLSGGLSNITYLRSGDFQSRILSRKYTFIAYASTITPNLSSGSFFRIPLSGNLTLVNPTGPTPRPGDTMAFEFDMDATGNRVITFGGQYLVNGWQPNPNASTNSSVTFTYNSPNWIMTASQPASAGVLPNGSVTPASTSFGGLPSASSFPGLLVYCIGCIGTSGTNSVCISSGGNNRMAFSDGTTWRCQP
jgi:hypothetical protein